MRQFLFWLAASALMLIFQGVSSAQDVATWTDATGEFQIAAEFCGVKERKVFLKSQNGKIIQVPIEALSETSRTQAKKLFLRMPTVAGSGETLNLSENRPNEFKFSVTEEPKQDNIQPRYNRWVVHIKANGVAELAVLLDAFHIEIGVIGGNYKGVQSVNQLSAGRPHVLTEMNPAKETRMYFMNTDRNELLNMQRQLAEKAGVETKGRTMLTFIPEQLENVLAYLERESSKTHGALPLPMIKRTEFEISMKGNQPTLAIIDLK